MRLIYKSYPVYAYGKEPPGYFESLAQQEPVVTWDDKCRRPSLETDADWIRAGGLVFDAPLVMNTNVAVEDVRDGRWLGATGAPVAADGTLPGMQYVIRKKGLIELGSTSCGFCHTRVMPDGSKLKGAQGNLPVQRAVAFRWRTAAAAAPDKDQFTAQTLTFLKRLHAAPYLRPDPQDRIDTMSIEEIASLFDSYPADVERIRGPVFLVSAGDDLAWPSLRMGREVRARLATRPNGPEVQLWEYPIAGHAIGPPGIGTNLSLGGTLSANAQASKDAYQRLRAFLHMHLGEFSPQ